MDRHAGGRCVQGQGKGRGPRGRGQSATSTRQPALAQANRGSVPRIPTHEGDIMNNDGTFLRAIEAAPLDAAPRLIYADWLEENGQADRGEFIRLDVARSAGWRAYCSQQLGK